MELEASKNLEMLLAAETMPSRRFWEDELTGVTDISAPTSQLVITYYSVQADAFRKLNRVACTPMADDAVGVPLPAMGMEASCRLSIPIHAFSAS